jgi:hypothetical protein
MARSTWDTYQTGPTRVTTVIAEPIPPPPPPPQPRGETTLEQLRQATTSLLRSARRKLEKVKHHLKRKMARGEDSSE